MDRTTIYAFAAIAGLLAGLASFTFVYAKGGSYLSNDAAACANCHVMREQFAAWERSSHRAVAACNDCHAPKGFLEKYGVKMLNGIRHSWAFTTGNFNDVILITDFNREITERACLSCHGEMTAAMNAAHAKAAPGCLSCHRSAGHMH